MQYVPVGDTEALSQQVRCHCSHVLYLTASAFTPHHSLTLQNITTINMPFLGFAGEYLEDIYLYYNCTGECLFTNRTIKDVVFGYNDSFLEQFGLSYPGMVVFPHTSTSNLCHASSDRCRVPHQLHFHC